MKYSALLRFICLSCLLTAVSACGGLTQSGQKNVSSGDGASRDNKTVVAGDVTNGSSDARTEVVKAYQSFLARPFYRVHTVDMTRNAANTAYTMDYVAPDRYEIKHEGDSDAKNSDIIGIGQETWFKHQDQPWKKSPVNIGAMKDMQKSWLDKINDKNTEVKLAGTESLDGAPMNVYQISYNIEDKEIETTIKGTGKVWIGATDHLPHKSEINSQTEDNSQKLTTTYDYNTAVKIEPPM